MGPDLSISARDARVCRISLHAECDAIRTGQITVRKPASRCRLRRLITPFFVSEWLSKKSHKARNLKRHFCILGHQLEMWTADKSKDFSSKGTKISFDKQVVASGTLGTLGTLHL